MDILHKTDLESLPVVLQEFVEKNTLGYPLGFRQQGTCKPELAGCSLFRQGERTSLMTKALWMRNVEKETENQ